MVDTQERLSMGNGDPVAKTAGALVIAAIVALVFLRRASIAISV